MKQVMKLWRTSRVDIDAKNKPCLERMMTMVEEGEIQSIPKTNKLPFDNGDDLSCSFEDWEHLVATIDTSWAENLRNRHISSR